jgi:ERCC4-related helicase
MWLLFQVLSAKLLTAIRATSLNLFWNDLLLSPNFTMKRTGQNFMRKANLSEDYKEADKWKVPYEKWLELIAKHDKATLKKIENPIDVLIATDCLSEGQNLQDCDTVVNYDIHWNPVRLIQRMGRIDRIGSPNKTIKGINFWPGKNYEDYLRLKSRVENRMALMSVVGTELDDKMTPEFQRMVEENPLLPKQAQKDVGAIANHLGRCGSK